MEMNAMAFTAFCMERKNTGLRRKCGYEIIREEKNSRTGEREEHGKENRASQELQEKHSVCILHCAFVCSAHVPGRTALTAIPLP